MLQPNTRRARVQMPAGVMVRGHDRRALCCLLLGLVALATGLVVALSHPAHPRAGTNGVWGRFPVEMLSTGQRVCQPGELLPAGATSIAFQAQALQPVGPSLFVTFSHGGKTLASTSLVVRAGAPASAPLPAPVREVSDVTVCIAAGGPAGQVALGGGPTPPGVQSLTWEGQPTGTSLSFTYGAAPRSSWWDRISTVTRRMALGRGDLDGRWVTWLLGALLLTSLVLVVRVLWRTVVAEPQTTADRPRRLPPQAAAVAAIAIANALAWSLITPPFQVPDEQTHVAYAQQIAEAGRPPVVRRGAERLSPELLAAMADTRFGLVLNRVDARTVGTAVWSPLQDRRLERDLHAHLARHGNDTAGPAAPEPPVYYGLEAIPYRLAHGATLLDRLALMRVCSALLTGLTALFALLFLRECLPRRPWAWSIGGLAVALTPMLGFVSGGVNPDALLFPVCAALFYAIAVAFRRGLTTGRALLLGALIGAGAITKINFYGIVPGALLAVALAARASAGGINRRSARLFFTTVGVGLLPFVTMTLLDAFLWDRAFILARTPAERPLHHGGLMGQTSFLWQLFLPRLPWQPAVFHGPIPAYDLLFKGFVGRFGWLVVSFAPWVYWLATILAAVLGALALRTGMRSRSVLRRRRAELVSYAAMAGGLLTLIALVALRGFAPGLPGAFQGRYLLPLLALVGGVIALAARGVGERWGRAAGVALVFVCVAWSLFGQLVTIAWFYG